MSAWGPVPWCLGPLPGVPGARPEMGVLAQSLQATSWPAPMVFASVFILILMSISDRFGVVLGSVLGVMFGHFGALVGQSWPQDRLRTVLMSKK